MHRNVDAYPGSHERIHRRLQEDGLLGVPFSHVREGEGGRMELQLSGTLPDDWCLRLANGLSASHVGLLNGYARRVQGEVWICQLEVQHASGSGRTPDFLDLATRGTLRRRREEPPILDYRLGAARDELLDLRVVAYDAVGLLAAVLHRVRAAGLAIDEVFLATEEEAATHRLVIRRRDGAPPRSIDRRAIAASLDAMVRSR